MTESEAIESCRKGEIAGLHVLYEAHRRKVYNLSWRILGSPHDAEDALQEIFIKVFDRVKNYRGDSAFSTWLYRIATNHCLDILRRRKVLSFLGFENFQEPPDKGEKRRLESELGLSPVLERALAKIPAKQRACLLMREMEEASYEEVAEALGMSLGSVKSNIHRAKGLLKELLEKEGVSPEDI